ncbi:hypothetical protein [Halobacillus sp. H74]|uniref:hypothetical protein n=1 Tax=Halobacillus sp. H74 TaxID=3457436 RepID=UPI003FCE7F50
MSEEQRDQTEKLRSYKDEGGYEAQDLDVLDLPPRKDVHQSKAAKTKWKVSNLWIRFLLIAFIVLISLILSYPYWDEWFKGTFMEPEIIQEETPYHEEITVERIGVG